MRVNARMWKSDLVMRDETRESMLNRRPTPVHFLQRLSVLLAFIVTFITVATIRSVLGVIPASPGTTANEILLLRFAIYAHAALLVMLTIFLGWFVNRYHRPFFVLLFHGYLFWSIEYTVKCAHIFQVSTANGFESYFFLSAGMVLAAPESWGHSIRLFPAYDAPVAPILRPAIWLARYIWNNPIMIVPLIVMIIPEVVEKPFPWLYQTVDALFFMTAVMVLGFGLYQRLRPVSLKTANAALIVHSIYLWPQIGNCWWKLHATPGVHNGILLQAIHIPALVLKPALALFATLVAIREIDEERRSAIITEMKTETRNIQRLNATESFTRNNIHDLRMNLQMMDLDIDTIERRLAKKMPVDSRDLQSIIARHYRISALVQPENQHHHDPVLKCTPIGDCIKKALDPICARAEKLNIALSLDDNGLADVRVRCDQDLFIVALVNLLFNAVESVRKDGEVRIRLLRRQAWICITVIDSGPGVPDDLQDKLFQLGSTTRPGGTGVGLTESKKAVESMGGMLRFVGNKPGAIFEIALRNGGEQHEVKG